VADPDMVMEGAAVVVDLDGDGADEVVTAAYEALIAIDGAGDELWRFDTRGRYQVCPAVLERQGDAPLIFAGDNKGLLTCVDGTGAVVWQAEAANMFCASPALADLDGDGRVELVQGDQAGIVRAFDAVSGEPKWQRALEGGCASPAIADLDSDGARKTLMATGAGKLYAIAATGEILWDFAVGGTSPDWATSSPIVFHTSENKPRIIVASQLGRVACLDGEGTVQWERAVRGGVASTLSAADFDADGRADIFLVTQLGVLYRFDEDGRVIWNIDTQGRSLAAGAIADLDGDGSLEYLLCTQRGNLLAFNRGGEIVYNHQFDHRTINVTPAFGNIVSSRPGLEFVVTGGESGQLRCFGTEALVDSPTPWRGYREDLRQAAVSSGSNTSGVVRMTAENLRWDALLTGDAVTFRIANPNSGTLPLKAEASCVGPNGTRQVAVGKVVGGSGLLELPLSIVAPGIYRFGWALRDAHNKVLVEDARELTLEPFRNDRALAARVVRLLDGFSEHSERSDSTEGLLQLALDLIAEAESLELEQAGVPGASPDFTQAVVARTETLNGRLRRTLTIAELVAAAPADRIIAFEGDTWENRDVDRQLPSKVANPLGIVRRSVVGEHEPVSIKLFNPTAQTVAVEPRVGDIPEGVAVTLYTVEPVATNQPSINVWDPMNPLDGGMLQLAPFQTRELWVDIDLADAKPGTHSIPFAFIADDSVSRATVTLDVLPFKLASAAAMRLCAWSSYNEGAVKDLLAHGNTVFTASLPPAEVSEDGGVTVDFTTLDTFIAPMAGHDVYLLMQGIPALGVEMESEAYVPRFKAYLDHVFDHLADKGISSDRIALYPHDEPGVHGWDVVNHYLAFARQGKKARPSLQFYVNGGGDLAMFEALNEVASIWCPHYHMLPDDSPEMNFIRNSGKTVWSYDCAYIYSRPIGANIKTINVVAQYRLAPVFALGFGVTGLGYWCYNVGPSMWDPIELEYPLVYRNSDDTAHTSRRWEAVREGMEDARILLALREKLSKGSVRPAAKEAIKDLLEESVRGMAKQSLDEVKLGVARYVLDATNNDAAVSSLRSEMLDCVALLASTHNQ
jgi:outer membrane protein assembly factor BamB